MANSDTKNKVEQLGVQMDKRLSKIEAALLQIANNQNDSYLHLSAINLP